MSRPCSPNGSTASSSPAGARIGAPDSKSPRPGCRFSMSSRRPTIPDRFRCCPTISAAPGSGTAHLARLGRRRIAHVTGPDRFEAVRLRRDGWRAALGEADLPAPELACLSGAWSEAWGREALGRLFAGRRTRPDAIFCGNDQIARGVADALGERGLFAPRDVAIVGFDNWDVIAGATRPPLTSVDMNLKELGRETGRRLVAMIAGERLTGVRRLPCSLIIRESCGARMQASA